jgi:hypothetical protein
VEPADIHNIVTREGLEAMHERQTPTYKLGMVSASPYTLSTLQAQSESRFRTSALYRELDNSVPLSLHRRFSKSNRMVHACTRADCCTLPMDVIRRQNLGNE